MKMQVMRHALKLISSFFLISFLAACTAPPKKAKKSEKKASYQKIYYASYDNVWRAAQLALKYPIAMNNMDNGVLETEFIKADEGFQPPFEEESGASSGLRYKINMILVKGKSEGRDSVRVTIRKTTEKRRDFLQILRPSRAMALKKK